MRAAILLLPLLTSACREPNAPVEPVPVAPPRSESRALDSAPEAPNAAPEPPTRAVEDAAQPKPLGPARSGDAAARLWLPGESGPDDAVPEDRAAVLALCDGALQAGAVRVTTRRGDPDKRRVKGPCAAVALLEGVPGLAAGPVAPAITERRELSEVAVELSSELRLRSEARGEAGYAVLLDVRGQSWVLAEHASTDGGAPKLLWAGDLDADGELDLLVDVTPKYSVELVRLYLSSAAIEGPLAQVAERRRVVD